MTTLKELRLARGWTQKQLAELAGIREGLVRKIERGAFPVERVSVEKVLQALGTFEEEVDGLKIARPLSERVNKTFTRGAVMPRNMDIIF